MLPFYSSLNNIYDHEIAILIDDAFVMELIKMVAFTDLHFI